MPAPDLTTETASPAPAVPAGFVPMPCYGPFHDLTGPFYEKLLDDGRTIVGMFIDDKHRNGSDRMHGGMYLMLADTAMTRAGSRARPEDHVCVTSTLSSEFIAGGEPGDWLEAEVELLKGGRKVLFLNCMVRKGGADGDLLLRASATFQIVPRKD